MSSLLGNNILVGASEAGKPPYVIENSLRFNGTGDGSGGDYLSRTTSSAGSGSWTLSTWIKLSNLSDGSWSSGIFGAHSGSTATQIYLESNDKIRWYENGGDINATARVFRDPASWMHLVFQKNSSTSIKIYVNGELADSDTSGVPSTSPATNSGATQYIGQAPALDGTRFASFCGYQAEINFVESVLTPSDFAELNTDTNQWVPKKYAGNYPSGNSFYLKFADSSALGTDSSGLSNTFSVTNLVATDQVLDSPTNNFATFSPLVKSYLATTFTEGNLCCRAGSGWVAVPATFAVSSGKWYMEFVPTTTNSRFYVVGDNSTGFFDDAINPQTGNAAIGYIADGNKAIDNTETAYGASWASGDIIAIALNMDDSEVTFYKNNASQGTISFSGNITSAKSVIPFALGAWYGDTNTYANFGADSSFAAQKTAQNNADGNGYGDFYYSPPTGFLALCADNLPDPSIALPEENFNTILYTGTGGATQAQTGVGFSPAFVWIKDRGQAYPPNLWDTVRGVQKLIESSSNGGQSTQTDMLNVFGTDGFTHGNQNAIGKDTDTYVAWNWKAATTFDPATAGTVTTGSGKSNSSAGFSIVQYTGESGSITVGHGLSQAPECIILKNLDGTYMWSGYFEPVGNTKSLSLGDGGAAYTEKTWNDTTPSATVFTLGASTETSSHRFNYTGEDFIAYCFHSVEGYSKVGSYEGNASADGVFIYTGFRPAFLIAKNSGASGKPWVMYDDKRDTYNEMYKQLVANDNAAANTSEGRLDFVSNGIKWRIGDSYHNDGSFIYIAFAANPFKYSNAR